MDIFTTLCHHNGIVSRDAFHFEKGDMSGAVRLCHRPLRDPLHGRDMS